jgi:uncharacterized membrane protein
VPAGLILLIAIPVFFAFVRGAELAGDPEVTADNARYVAMPVPIMVHIIGGIAYCLFGALQFAPVLRQHRRRWHRYAGRVLVPAGIAVAGSGIWMTLFQDLPALDGWLTNASRLVFAAFMLVSLVLGYLAIRRRDLAAHRAWMMRGYAVAAGAGTQAFTHGAWYAAVGEPGVTAHGWLMAAGWLINLAVAEWFIRRRSPRPRPTPIAEPVAAG